MEFVLRKYPFITLNIYKPNRTPELFKSLFRSDSKISFFASGIIFQDRISLVSPTLLFCLRLNYEQKLPLILILICENI